MDPREAAREAELEASRAPFMEHLVELRTRLWYAILGVIETPAGERPLRTVVDGMGFAAGPEAINQTSDGVQQQTLEGMGVAALLKLRAAE